MARAEVSEVLKGFTIPSQIIKVTSYSEKLKIWHLVKALVELWNEISLPLSPEQFFLHMIYLELRNSSKHQFSDSS